MLYLDINHPIIKSFLDMPCKYLFDKMSYTLADRSDEMYKRFIAVKEALEFLETNSSGNDGDALVRATEAVINLGILRYVVWCGDLDLAKGDNFWVKLVRPSLLSMSVKLTPIAAEIFDKRASKFRNAVNNKWEDFLLYFTDPYWKDMLMVSGVPSDEIAKWDEINKNLLINHGEYQNIPKDTDDIETLSLRLKCLENIKNNLYSMQQLRLGPSREVQKAVEIMKINEDFFINDELRLYFNTLSDNINNEIKNVSNKIETIILAELKNNVKKYIKDPLDYVKQGRIYVSGYYAPEVPVVGKAFKKGGVSGESSLRKVEWSVPDKDNVFSFRVVDTMGIVYVHAFVEGNIKIPPINGGEGYEQRIRLHLIRPLVLERGKHPLGPVPQGVSSQESQKYDLSNRVFVGEIETNRKPVDKEAFDSVIRNILFEVYDK